MAQQVAAGQWETGMDRNMTILVVDDFSPMRRITRKLLRDLGFENTLEADDGDSALPVLRRGGVDLLVTDWNMPGMSGIELLKMVRADAQLASLPVLMVSAESGRERIIEATRAGVDGYLVKPFAALTLKRAMERIFEPAAALVG
jgi:two-component system chemotaxis response regulator CheY